MFRAIGRFLLQRWLPLAAGLAVAGLLASLAYVNFQAGREQVAVTAQKRATAAIAEAHAAGLPAPPPATGTVEQQTVHGYKQHLLTPPPGPGTMADVEADAIRFTYVFAGVQGHSEYVGEEIMVRDIEDYPLSSLVIPLLSGASSAHLSSIQGVPLQIHSGRVTLPIHMQPFGPYELVTITYVVPYDFLADQTWTVPTYARKGVWISFPPQVTYLRIVGRGFHKNPAISRVIGGWPVWTSDAPLPAGSTLRWSIQPNAGRYPSVERPPVSPHNCVSPTGQPLCKVSGK